MWSNGVREVVLLLVQRGLHGAMRLCLCARRVCPNGEPEITMDGSFGLVVKRARQERRRLGDSSVSTTPCGLKQIEDLGPDPPRRAAEGHRDLDSRMPRSIWCHLNTCSSGPQQGAAFSARQCRPGLGEHRSRLHNWMRDLRTSRARWSSAGLVPDHLCFWAPLGSP